MEVPPLEDLKEVITESEILIKQHQPALITQRSQKKKKQIGQVLGHKGLSNREFVVTRVKNKNLVI